MTFLDTQCAECFCAIQTTTSRLRLLPQHVEHFSGVVGRQVCLERHLAREADTCDAPWNVVLEGGLHNAHEWQIVIADIDRILEHRFQHLTRLGAGDCDTSPLLTDRCQMHSHIRPANLHELFEKGHDLDRMRGGGGHEILVLTQSPGGAIIQHHAVVAKHDAVACLADRKLGEGVRVDPVQQLRSVGPLNGNLAERGDVTQGYAFARGGGLPDVGITQTFALAREIPGSVPQTGFGHRAALVQIPLMHRGASQGAEMCADATADQRTQTDRGVGWAECRGADVRDVFTQSICHQGKTDHIAHFALVGCHAQGGVTFQMLDRHITFVVCQPHIVGGHIVLRINKALELLSRHAHFVQRSNGRLPATDIWCLNCGDAFTQRNCGLRAGGTPGSLTGFGLPDASGRARHLQRLVTRGRQKAGQCAIPNRFDAAVREQVYHWRPAT